MTHQAPKDMDIHFKDGVLRCKHCKAVERTKWPAKVSDLLKGGCIEKAMMDFQLRHTRCAWAAHGYTSDN